jgi:hypothetical protein
VVSDLLLFPHCDLHYAMVGSPQIKLKVAFRTDDPTQPGRYKLTFTNGYSVDFFAPFNAVRHRFDNLPTVDPATGTITANTPGVYLFQVTAGDHYIVGRLQVHNAVSDWWFGNDSLSTAKDPVIAHAQPSVYAKFSDDAAGTDLIGDITGHGFVTLATTDATKVVVDADRQRLRGVAETDVPVTVNGTFLAKTLPLPVRVVDYDKERKTLNPVQLSNVAQADTMHNIVFLAEGFRQEDGPFFNRLVHRVAGDLFAKPRHQPFAMLSNKFNVFTAFEPSQQGYTTCGYQVVDTAGGPPALGSPIPFERAVGPDRNAYTPRELIAKVGLPRHRGDPDDPRTVWRDQDLDGYDPARATDPVVAAWKRQRSTGILQTSDTFFGMILGRRWADRASGAGPVPRPAAGDTVAGAADLKAYIKRMYEFYTKSDLRLLTPDPRRHPPELFAGNVTNPVGIVLRYLAGLRYFADPFPPVGAAWIPDDNHFKPSRGLVVLLTLDAMDGGTNNNNFTFTAQTLHDQEHLDADYVPDGVAEADRKIMRRSPGVFTPKYGMVTDTAAHELAHSFNLLDEYESTPNDDPADDAGPTDDSVADNTTRLGFLRINPHPDRSINVDKLKWLAMPRILVADRMLADTVAVAGGIQVTVDPRTIGKWVKANADGALVDLRSAELPPSGRQLPLPPTPDKFREKLPFVGKINEAAGTFVLALAAPPVFKAGSVVFVPSRDGADDVSVIDKRVRDLLRSSKKPLNLDPDITRVNPNNDESVDVPGLTGPCKPARLIGLFEGAETHAGGRYRATGACKMRSLGGGEEGTEFCFVCRWLIVNRVDPGFHNVLDKLFYPGAKKNG